MSAERSVKRVLAPVTGPSGKRRLIAGRDALVGVAAEARGRTGWATRPQFLIVGAQKAGTTYLYQELVRHPQVHAALTKEIHFFDDGYGAGLHRYFGYFPRRMPAGHLTGEASPGYMFHPHALDRIGRDLPGVKLIVLLRDPVARAYSQFRHEQRLGFETETSFARALDAEARRTDGEWERLASDPTARSFPLRHASYRARGIYLPQIEHCHAAVGRDRVLVLQSEHLYTDPAGALRAVEDFLGLDRWTPEAFGANDMDAGAAAVIDPAVADELRSFYAPHNAALFEYLGASFEWRLAS